MGYEHQLNSVNTAPAKCVAAWADQSARLTERIQGGQAERRHALFLLPQRGKAENGKRVFSQPEWIGCLGHSNWTICSPSS